ncbi:MAG: DUF4838 domain-containing protein [Candidatus Omnitrophica bacterium]|nr:DUF4838 domain-containing protein [Candidatus Omnitrophota bacterium]
MKRILYLFYPLMALSIAASTAEARLVIAEGGEAQVAVFTEKGATATELYAAKELADTLRQVTGATFETNEVKGELPEKAILVGPGQIARDLFPEVPFDQLGDEEIVIRTKGKRLLLAGGRPRGTLYAVSRFLQDDCGVRWWTPWATTIPHRPNLMVPDLDVRQKPAFESRDPFWFPAFDGDWAVRNFSNSQSARINDDMGGTIKYKGFVHTFYPLVPPDPYFKEHPEWFSLINGKRSADHAQLCLTNPQLRDFVVERVKQWLRESPEARIVSVSQNDWHGNCQCPVCKAIDDAEGSPSGSLLTFVNYIAAKIAPDFPDVAIDTLAYQYTRKAPKTIKPLPNVIVRLCSIECNFGASLEDPSNEKFAQDIRDWSKLCNRLYIWDYTTDFAHYVQPHPNWFSLGPNVRFFQAHHVKGLFEQGAYQSNGAEMSEMRAWVLAQLLWNPQRDDRALIDEFLDGYYGKPAAEFIRRYMDLVYEASRGYYLSCYSPPTAPFLSFKVMARAERLWQQAETAARTDQDLLWRVRLGHLPVRYVFLTQWEKFRAECTKAGENWPLNPSRHAAADEWLTVATGAGPKGWSKLTHLNESGLTPETFIARFANDPPEP